MSGLRVSLVDGFAHEIRQRDALCPQLLRLAQPFGIEPDVDEAGSHAVKISRLYDHFVYFLNQYTRIPYPTPAGSVVFAVWNAMNRPSVETTGFDALPLS